MRASAIARLSQEGLHDTSAFLATSFELFALYEILPYWDGGGLYLVWQRMINGGWDLKHQNVDYMIFEWL